MFFGGKKGKIWPPGQTDPKGTPTAETRLWVHWPKIHASQGKLRTRGRNQKKLKSTRGTTSRLRPPRPPFAAAAVFCMWGRTVDLIKHAKFQVNQFRGFGAPWGRKWPSSIDLAHRPYNSVRTNVLHCDDNGIRRLSFAHADLSSHFPPVRLIKLHIRCTSSV